MDVEVGLDPIEEVLGDIDVEVSGGDLGDIDVEVSGGDEIVEELLETDVVDAVTSVLDDANLSLDSLLGGGGDALLDVSTEITADILAGDIGLGVDLGLSTPLFGIDADATQTISLADPVDGAIDAASDGDVILSLLSLTFEPGEDGAGALLLTLAGDGAIRLEVAALDVTLRDVTRPYTAPSRRTPAHPD